MSVTRWAVKPGELRGLARGPRLVWAARCAMRLETWRPPGVAADWDEGLRRLAAAADAAPGAIEVAALARALGDRGASACNARDGTAAEALGRCMNYATQALAGALTATGLAAPPAVGKAVLDVARLAGSIPAVLAHAGATRTPRGRDPVETAATAIWDAMRADLARCAGVTPPVTVAEIRALGPLWPPGALARLAP